MKPYGYVEDDNNGNDSGASGSMGSIGGDDDTQVDTNRSIFIRSMPDSELQAQTGTASTRVFSADVDGSTGGVSGASGVIGGNGDIEVDMQGSTSQTLSTIDSDSSDFSGDVVPATDSDDPDEIRAGIEQTRNDMSSTINAIQDKLNPQVLMDQAKDTLHSATSDILEQAKDTVREVTTGLVDNAKETVHDATVGRVEHMVTNAADTAKSTGSSVIDMVKQNPIPAAAIGLGLSWLFGRNKGGSSGGNYQPQNYGRQGYGQQNYSGSNYGQGYGDDYSRRYSGSSGNSEGMVDQVVNGIRENPLPSTLAGLGVGWWLMNRQGNSSGGQSHPSAYRSYEPTYLSQNYGSQGNSGGAMDRVQEKVGDVTDQLSSKAGDVAEKVGDVVGQAGDVVGQAAGQIGQTAGNVAGAVGQTAGNVAGAVGQTAGNVAGGTGDVLGGFVRAIAQNPIPAAIAGVSLGWLLMKGNSSDRQTSGYSNNYSNYSGSRDYSSESKGNIVSTAGEVVGNAAGAAGDAVGNVAGAAGDAVGNVAGAAGDAVSNVGGAVKEQTQHAQTEFQRLLMENPLVVGAAVAVIGAAVGMAVPETPQEHQLMGQARDNLLDKAQSVAQDTLQKVQQVTDQAGQTIQSEAQNQGLV